MSAIGQLLRDVLRTVERLKAEQDGAAIEHLAAGLNEAVRAGPGRSDRDSERAESQPTPRTPRA